MKASIIAVGTEITTGQILNKNASWISSNLKAAGVLVTVHITVPDDRQLILDALNFAEKQSEVIFVTGGLGPTSDDFTRDLICTWTQTKMIFNEMSWQHIQDRLKPRGFPVRDIQKQQCYFPEGASILKNAEGTANAFYLHSKQSTGLKKIFVLPGPPREIESIWKDHVANWLTENTKTIQKQITKSWDTMGVGESDVALKVEEVLVGRPKSDTFEIGYRVHLPYVEVKLSFLENELAIWQPYLDKVDSVLSEITITKDFKDLAEMVTSKIKSIDFTFYDYVTSGYLQNRLAPYLKSHPNYSWKQSTDTPLVDLFENEDNFLALIPYEADKSLLIFSLNGKRKQVFIEAPMKSTLMAERRKQYSAEMTLAYFNRA
ncbi:MAG: competence/damage-inducible protein A [Pseudobdellovibrio sp.]